jgi:hypothetical protein
MNDGSVQKFEDELLDQVFEESGPASAIGLIKRELIDAATVLLRIK